MKGELKFIRQPSKAELRHIITKIWCVCIDFEALRENDMMEEMYNDSMQVITSKMTLDAFTSEYVCDTYDELYFEIVYETYEYLKKKKIIN